MVKKGLRIIGIMFLLLAVGFVSAEKLSIENIEEKYIPGEGINFTINLYDDNLQKIEGNVNYEIKNYYLEIVDEGIVGSGVENSFIVPENAYQGMWEISASYDNVSQSQRFTIGELQKVDIRLEKDQLIVENKGNVPYDKRISIFIGEHNETAWVKLGVGQTKKIKLTAPQGQYNVKVSDGTDENTFEVKKVQLTGNAIGLERIVEGGFFKKYPMVSLFLVSMVMVIVAILGIKGYYKFK